MANPQKGDVEFTVAKKVYTLKFSINAMVELEDKLGGSIVDIANTMSDPAKMGVKMMRTVFWAGLRDHHEAMTETDAGRIMEEIGLVEASQMVAKAFALAFPEAQAPVPLQVPAKRQAGSTGKAH
jgi:hypothetical protein